MLNLSKILDIATGTGDLAIAAMRLKPKKITGVDISEEMLEIGRKKILNIELQHIIGFEKGDSEQLRFDEGTFDGAMVAFGVRNFENLDKGPFGNTPGTFARRKIGCTRIFPSPKFPFQGNLPILFFSNCTPVWKIVFQRFACVHVPSRVSGGLSRRRSLFELHEKRRGLKHCIANSKRLALHQQFTLATNKTINFQ